MSKTTKCCYTPPPQKKLVVNVDIDINVDTQKLVAQLGDELRACYFFFPGAHFRAGARFEGPETIARQIRVVFDEILDFSVILAKMC